MKNKKTITIIIIVDVVGILASDSIEGNVYIFDDNKANGSFGHGTETLTTKLVFDPDEETTLLWNITAIDPESYIGISQIVADKKYLDVKKDKFKGSDIMYWIGTIKKPFGQELSYSISIQAENRNKEYSCNLNLIGELKSK